MRPAPVAWPLAGRAPHSWPSLRRPQTPLPTPSARLSHSTVSPVAPGSYTPTRPVPWPGKRHCNKYPPKERKDLQYLGAEQCRIILGPAHITKSVESRLYGMHDCLRIAGCGRKEMLQTGQSELRPLRVLAFVRA